MQSDVFAALKEGNESLKQINSQMSAEDIEKLMEETEEGIAYQNVSFVAGAFLT
jgi:hypothetical protein